MTFFERLQAETETPRRELLRVQIIQDALAGRIRLAQYIGFLTQAYHHVKHTVPLLMACGGRLPQRVSWLRAAIAEYIREEIGHEEWILSDIAACGADAERVRGGWPNFATEQMVTYAYHQIDRGNPVAFLGMVHVLEGTSVAIATSAAGAIGAALGLPAAAFTYLSSHGRLDIAHVQVFETLMNRLDDPHDQAAVIDCAQSICRLYGDIFRSLPSFEANALQEAA